MDHCLVIEQLAGRLYARASTSIWLPTFLSEVTVSLPNAHNSSRIGSG